MNSFLLYSTLYCTRLFRLSALGLRATLFVLGCSLACVAQVAEPREWTDSTGGFKVTATLIEVKDGTVFLTTNQGKSLRIPLTRLSKADQEFLKGGGGNPFQEIGADQGPMPTNAFIDDSASNTSGANGASGWNSPLKIEWNDVEELDRSFDGVWKLNPPKQSDLGFPAKRSTLNKKNHAHEDIRRIQVNPLAKRAVVGYTVSFTLPKPQSRLALIDLVSGKSIHSNPIECDMCPLALFNDGSIVLMQGTSDERKGFETQDQLQVWKVTGKKVIQSKTWIPFPDDSESWGKKANGTLLQAISLPNNKLILLSGNGHLVCIDSMTRKPFWHSRLSQHFALDASLDRSLLAVQDGHTIMIVDPQTGTVKSSAVMEDKPHLGWPRICWGSSGTKLLVSYMSELRVLDLTNGEWTQRCSFTGGPIAANGLSYPHDDYALLNDHLLVHIPSQIKVCEYRGARLVTVGGTSFVGMQGGDGGVVFPTKIPHPSAEKILAQAEKDPSVFLIHPGVQVSVDAGAAGQWSNEVTQSLTQAATNAGYKVVPGAAISIVGSITGPKQEAVSYIGRGSYIANSYQSTIRVTWQGKDVWTTGSNNIPGFLQTSRDETIQGKLDELGKTPNLSVFANSVFPKLLQKPSDTKTPGAKSEALLLTNCTDKGFIDTK